MWYEQQKFVKPTEALEALRDLLGLHEHIPAIERIHMPEATLIDVQDRTISICAHDSANRCTYAIFWPAPEGPRSLGIDLNGDVSDEVRVHCEQFLCAAYN